jgi:hypothetical protein
MVSERAQRHSCSEKCPALDVGVRDGGAVRRRLLDTRAGLRSQEPRRDEQTRARYTRMELDPCSETILDAPEHTSCGLYKLSSLINRIPLAGNDGTGHPPLLKQSGGNLWA